MRFTVSSVPTDDDTKTNHIFLHPSDYAACPEVQNGYTLANGFPFIVKRHEKMEQGKLGMNAIQRRLLKISSAAGGMVDLQPLAIPQPKLVQLTFRVEHLGSKKGGSVDCKYFTEVAKNLFLQQVFREMQQLVVLLPGGLRLTATVEGIVLDPAANSKGDMGLFDNDTMVLVTATKESEISLENMSEKQMDAQQANIVQDFDLENLGIGGLHAEFGQVFRRAFASRIFPASYVKKLGVKHAKGVLLYGPPGTGKTLIARKIGEILNCHEPKIVNGPEVFSKFVGGTEENIRKLFADAEAEQAAKGDQSQLHLIIFDEFDAICKQRGAVRDSTGTNDNAVNQLLSKIDGVNSLNNVLLIGMTNRKDLIDEAILRPGRFEVHVEIGLPDEPGREEIFRIHTRGMRENKIMGNDVDLAELASLTKNYSGAEIEGVVRSATSNAFNRHMDRDHPGKIVDADNIFITRADFMLAIDEVTPAFGQAKEECANLKRGGIIEYGGMWNAVKSRCHSYVQQLNGDGKRIQSLSVLIDGPTGSGKSAIAAFLAEQAEFPYIKVISNDDMVGYGELQRVNIIRKAFEDAYKSAASCIILDDLERLIDFSQLGGRYSNALLQALLVLVKRPPPEGKKLLVVATTSQFDIMESLELAACFSVKLQVPNVPPDAIPLVAESLNIAFATQQDKESCVNLSPRALPIKQLLLILEMGADRSANAGGKAILTYGSFQRALESAGIQ
ncbi:N-ethylmaleimide-sensitive factor [Angomonas deanei]|uniref:Vesicle-fusing ATPase n=1 Tax=Angomonas deanei TaxID=59799 RepID=A0A7G2C808_9TRYP|nr:N-ethylmaleimide-sensitive factor [Angomonas deanei]CAD2215234.1 ATPase family associated with various cellular activities (AAA)/AAA+ lid domain containing protein, putative [Angomonas deanei]|eukprot:EPY34814.1 N-ethylmaleimide-sensitive factor [Angomonas deanei]